ncbi:MAG TPA: phosphoenolpyruvate--protein phosphotransferase, partial [Candidatus Pelethocola excrementipullorum]|nr:phosphoenolpyruvate--protein phosphotransferase [Candidatus Pelethocola excrementipullorum]
NAEYAVKTTRDIYVKKFESVDDAYMKERATDMRDISDRVIAVLMGGDQKAANLEGPVILLAEDLTPSETIQMDREKILAFVTVQGSTHSHAAILSRTMGIPALIGVQIPLDDCLDGKLAAVDGERGVIYLEPDEETQKKIKELQREESERKQQLARLKGSADITLDGRRVAIYANIGNLGDLEAVKANDAAGIGLFRSEFLYLEEDRFPTEEEQFLAYKSVLETMGNKKVIIRTLDIGADKQCAYFQMEKEENPALGLRGIRVSLTRPEIFKTQIKALLRASAYGNLSILYPMITSLWEIRKVKELVEESKMELIGQNIPMGNPEQGIMIETPAAVMVSEELAQEVDFFSIGTNDLTQYTLGMDRQNPNLDPFYDPYHPAVRKMIAIVVESAHKAGIQASICGEIGADSNLITDFLSMGVDGVSVSPGSILPIRKIVRNTDLSSK